MGVEGTPQRPMTGVTGDIKQVTGGSTAGVPAKMVFSDGMMKAVQDKFDEKGVKSPSATILADAISTGVIPNEWLAPSVMVAISDALVSVAVANSRMKMDEAEIIADLFGKVAEIARDSANMAKAIGTKEAELLRLEADAAVAKTFAAVGSLALGAGAGVLGGGWSATTAINQAANSIATGIIDANMNYLKASATLNKADLEKQKILLDKLGEVFRDFKEAAKEQKQTSNADMKEALDLLRKLMDEIYKFTISTHG